MYEKILKLKEDKKWLFYLLIIPFALAFIYEMYNKYLVNSGKQIVKDAEKKDEELLKKQQKAEAGADYHKQKADQIEKDIENKKVNEDWNKK